MSKDVSLQLDLKPQMTIAQFVAVLMDDFEKTGLNKAEFDIPGTDGKRQFLLNFDISLITINERSH